MGAEMSSTNERVPSNQITRENNRTSRIEECFLHFRATPPFCQNPGNYQQLISNRIDRDECPKLIFQFWLRGFTSPSTKSCPDEMNYSWIEKNQRFITFTNKAQMASIRLLFPSLTIIFAHFNRSSFACKSKCPRINDQCRDCNSSQRLMYT